MAVTMICKKCGVKMHKEKSGLKIKLANNYCQHGDIFQCPVCFIEVIADTGKPHPDRNPDVFDLELKRR